MYTKFTNACMDYNLAAVKKLHLSNNIKHSEYKNAFILACAYRNLKVA